MCALNVIGTATSTGISASYLNQLISQTMALKQKPLQDLQSNRDALEVQSGMYSDLSGYLSTLQTQAANLMTGATAFTARQATSTDPGYVNISAGSAASLGTYTVKNISLAQAQQVRSRQFDSTDNPLGISGTFYLGGYHTPAAPVISGGEAGTVSAAGRTSVSTGQTQLGSGQYKLEVKNSGTTDAPSWQFRMVDDAGEAVAIRDADNKGQFVAGWQDWVTDASTPYDTGRGLQLTLAASPSQAKAGSSAMTIDWQAQGTAITVQATDSLQTLRDTINGAAYPAGHGVQASIIDRQLLLTSTSTGTAHTLGTPEGDDLSFLDNAAGHLGLWNSSASWLNVNQAAADAQFTINGITATRQRNTGLTDVIPGVTLDLGKKTPDSTTAITLSISDDTQALKNQFNAFITQFNQVSSYLIAKTGLTKNSDGTYTRGGMAGDLTFRTLRANLLNDITKTQTGLSATAPTSLQALGIRLDTGDAKSDQAVSLKVTDSAAFDKAISDNRSGVLELINSVMGAVKTRVGAFTGSDGILSHSKTTLDEQVKTTNKRITDEQARLTAQEQLLTNRYATLLSQLAQAQTDYNTTASYLSYYTTTA